MNQLLTNRPMSGFPLSIGTSIALERIFDPIQPVYDETRIAPDPINRQEYTVYAFNIETLLRNLTSSIKFGDLLTISKREVYDALLEEVQFLIGFFGSNDIQIKPYVNTYAFIRAAYPPDTIRKASTEKQYFLDDMNKYCLDKIAKEDGVKIFSKDIRFNAEDSVLLLSHIPFDLLSYVNFTRLDLLESHTGTIKKRQHWNSKYLPIPGKDMTILPFMEYLLSIFGDHVTFKPAPIQKRIELYDAMVKRGVHPLTSELTMKFMFG